jgi:glucan phosphoethanolaminetransferase (alkaline phosphatase superfamily)
MKIGPIIKILIFFHFLWFSNIPILTNKIIAGFQTWFSQSNHLMQNVRKLKKMKGIYLFLVFLSFAFYSKLKFPIRMKENSMWAGAKEVSLMSCVGCLPCCGVERVVGNWE